MHTQEGRGRIRFVWNSSRDLVKLKHSAREQPARYLNAVMDPHFLQYIGAALAMLVGLTGLFKPDQMKSLVGLTYSNAVGLVEIRVLFGSFLVILPLAAIIHRQADIFVFYGLAAVAAAIIKTTFTLVDKCPLGAIWFGIVVDVLLAFLLLSSLYLN